MQEHVLAFVRTAAEAFELRGPVYEFGYCSSVDPHNGATLRDCFPDAGYIGCELGEEAQIDTLSSMDRLPLPDAAARTVICTGVLEHVFEPPRVVEEMVRILAPGGILVLSAEVEAGPCEAIDNYWRLTPHSVQRLLAPLEATLVAWQGSGRSPHTVFGIGCKGPAGGGFVRGVNRLIGTLPARLERLAENAGWRERLCRGLLGWMQPKAGRRRLRDFNRVQFVTNIPAAEPLSYELLAGGPPQQRTGSRLDLNQ